MLVCVIASQLQTLGVLSTIETNDTHWIRKTQTLGVLSTIEPMILIGFTNTNTRCAQCH